MKEFKFTIPTTKSDIKDITYRLKKKVYGHRCKSCNARLKYGTQYHSGFLNGLRFMIDGNGLCDACLIDAVNVADYKETVPCTWCDSHSGTYKFKYGSFHIGAVWWNGFYGCKQCLLEGIENIPLSSKIFRYGKSV